jgi:putative membrane protein
MNRRFLIKSAGFTAMGLSLSAVAIGADDSKPGKLDAAEFKKINTEAGAKVDALKPDSSKLSDADKNLAGEIALGGMMQLKAAELALETSKSPDVKLIAEGEAGEQRGLAAKLKEFAATKDIQLPGDLDEKGQKLISEIKDAGDKFDRAYLEKSGVAGHEELKKTMTKVKAEAKDPLLKALAETALPLIEVHLTVAKDEVAPLG